MTCTRRSPGSTTSIRPEAPDAASPDGRSATTYTGAKGVTAGGTGPGGLHGEQAGDAARHSELVTAATDSSAVEDESPVTTGTL